MDQRPPSEDSAADDARPGAEARLARRLAVAIRRESQDGQDGEESAGGERPRVIAKGEGALAEQILAIAFDRDIKVRSDADLAEILSAVEVDSEIPLEALAAVAEILSYVYRAAQPPEQTVGRAPGPATPFPFGQAEDPR